MVQSSNYVFAISECLICEVDTILSLSVSCLSIGALDKPSPLHGCRVVGPLDIKCRLCWRLCKWKSLVWSIITHRPLDIRRRVRLVTIGNPNVLSLFLFRLLAKLLSHQNYIRDVLRFPYSIIPTCHADLFPFAYIRIFQCSDAITINVCGACGGDY